jgi:hypothetical protein
MNHMSYNVAARTAEWLVQKNPTYLLSAAAMAVGARMYLVGPRDPAGDVTLILQTLAVLQLYVWAVGAILLLVERTGRSPEDRPSLLLVATLFWTGPLAATIEMTALRQGLGAGLAVGVSVIALGEMRAACRLLRLRLTWAGQLVGVACMILLAAAPPLLKIPDEPTGRNELFLYGAWLVMGLITLTVVPVVRSSCGELTRARGDVPRFIRHPDVVFAAVTVAATVMHLVGMNHAFFCHARSFYAAPFIIALSVVAMEYLAHMPRRPAWLLGIVAAGPGMALYLSTVSFHPAVSVDALPRLVRDPLLLMSLCAALAWWFGAARNRAVGLVHLGNASLGLFALQWVPGFAERQGITDLLFVEAGTAHGLLVWVLGVSAVYFLASALLRRRRWEGLVSLAFSAAAIMLAAWGRTEADGLIICLVLGWWLLIGMHVAMRRPHLVLRIVPICWVARATMFLDQDSTWTWYARGHTLMMAALLIGVGCLWAWTRYRIVGTVLLLSHLAWAAARLAARTERAAALAVVASSFLLLALGVAISWHKRRLMKWLRRADNGIAAWSEDA